MEFFVDFKHNATSNIWNYLDSSNYYTVLIPTHYYQVYNPKGLSTLQILTLTKIMSVFRFIWYPWFLETKSFSHIHLHMEIIIY